MLPLGALRALVQTKVRLFCVIFYLFGSSDSVAQFDIEGYLFDEEKRTALSYVSITISNFLDSTIIDYQITKDEGYFNFTGITNDSVLLIISSLEYESKYLVVRETDASQIDTIWLNPAVFNLEAIEVKANQNGIIINGDTTIYSPYLYTNGSEDNAGEVLEKLPGINIDDDGKVTFGNEEVDEMLIDGDNFLDSNRKGLLEGIKAQDIESIELIQNYNPSQNALLTNTKNRNLAINIKLSDQARSKIRYHARLGLGFKNKYDFGTELYRIDRKLKFFVNAQLDNTGQHQLSIYDYLKLEGGLGAFNAKTVSNGSGIPKIFYLGQRNSSVISQYVSSNFSYNPSHRLKINGYALAYNTQGKMRSFTEEIPFNQDILNTYTSASTTKLQNYLGKMNLAFQPSDKLVFRFAASLNIQDEDNSTSNITNLSGLEFMDNYQALIPQISTFASGSIQYNIDSSSVIKGQISVNLNSLDKDIKINSDSTINYNLNTAIISQRDINQTLNNDFSNVDYSLKYIKKIKRYKISTLTSFQSENQTLLNSGLNHDELPFNRVSNKILRKYLTWNSEIEYDLRFIEFGMGLNYFSVDFQQPNENNKTFFYPSAFFNLHFKRLHQKIRFLYNKEINLNDLPIAVNSLEFQAINKLFLFDRAPNTFLSKHNLQVTYQMFDAFAGTMFFFFLNYSSGTSIGENVKYYPTFELRNTILTPPEQLLFSGAMLDKKLHATKLGIKSKLLFGVQQDYSAVFDQLQEFVNTNLKFNIEAYTVRKNAVNLEAGLGARYGRFGAREAGFFSSIFDGNIKFLSKADGLLEWELGATLFFEQQNDQKNYYNNFQGELGWNPKNSNLRLSLVFNDIFNINSASRITSSQIGNNYRFSSFDILPGFALLKISIRN